MTVALSRAWPTLGAVPQADGRTAFRVWAPHAGSLAVELGGRAHPLDRGEDGLWTGELEAGHGDDYLLAARRRAASPGSALGLAARGAARAVARARPGRLRLDRRRLACSRRRRPGRLRAPRRHVQRRGDVRRRRRAPGRAPRARRQRDRAHARDHLPRRARLGLRRRAARRAASRLRRAGGARAPRRRRARRRAGRPARRRPQPRRPGRRRDPRRARPVLHGPSRDALGPRARLRRTAASASGRSSSPSAGSATTTSTACASTPSSTSSTTARATCWPSSPIACARCARTRS